MIKPRNDFISWDECFMKIAFVIAERSKDPSTQAGAVIVNEKNVVVGMGYNGWPRGIESDELPWERDGSLEDTKYAYVCHAEENAIYNANNWTENCKIYCTLFPCNECATIFCAVFLVRMESRHSRYNRYSCNEIIVR